MFIYAAAERSHCSICSWPTRPACWNTGLPPESTTKLGIPCTPKRAASSGCASVSTLRTIAFPAISWAVRATSGAAARQGPHHPAQKSTKTGTVAVFTTSSNRADRPPQVPRSNPAWPCTLHTGRCWPDVWRRHDSSGCNEYTSSNQGHDEPRFITTRTFDA